MVIQNAKIESTMLGFEDHGIFTCVLHLDYGGSMQGFGTHTLASKNDSKYQNTPVNYGAHYIMRILQVVGVDKWENLVGMHIRVKREDGWNGKIIAIGNIIKDEWFDPQDLLT